MRLLINLMLFNVIQYEWFLKIKQHIEAINSSSLVAKAVAFNSH